MFNTEIVGIVQHLVNAGNVNSVWRDLHRLPQRTRTEYFIYHFDEEPESEHDEVVYEDGRWVIDVEVLELDEDFDILD